MKNIVVIFIAVLIFTSCRKASTISDIPKITFTSLTSIKYSSSKDSTGLLEFAYEDGDGDLGSLSTDSTSYRNLFVKYFVKENGVFTAPVLLVGFDATIPNLTPKAKNKSISGDIAYSLILPSGVISDTVKFEVYIIDRANHKSNVIETSELVITTN